MIGLAVHEAGHASAMAQRGSGATILREAEWFRVIPDRGPEGAAEEIADACAGPLAELLAAARWEAQPVALVLARDGLDALDTRHSRFDLDKLAGMPWTEAAQIAVALDLLPRLAADLREVPERLWHRLADALDALPIGGSLRFAATRADA